MGKKWYHATHGLGGWHKNKTASARRKDALKSRPKSWSLNHKRLSAGRALMALHNVSKDKKTKKIARVDAKYFFRRLK